MRRGAAEREVDAGEANLFLVAISERWVTAGARGVVSYRACLQLEGFALKHRIAADVAKEALRRLERNAWEAAEEDVPPGHGIGTVAPMMQ